MPVWVVDYVLMHELAHLLENGHTDAFWRMVDRLPKAERARGFLEGVALAARLDISEDDVPSGLPDPVVEPEPPAESVTAEVDELTQ